MLWQQKGSWCLESDSGYRVDKTMNSGLALYTAFAPKKEYKTEIIGVKRSAEEAKNLCESHFKSA